MAEYRQFYNVYAHVPTENKVKRVQNVISEQSTEDRYTGVIQVSLKTRTPLFTPDTAGRTAKEEGTKHQKQEFFTYDGEHPVIPGSSLRGVLRNTHEAASNSCYSVVDLDDKPVKRTNEYYLPGLLYRDEDGNITLYEARKATVKYKQRPDFKKHTNVEDFKEGAVVYSNDFHNTKTQHLTVDLTSEGEILEKEKKSWTKGYYFKGEEGVKKSIKQESLNAYMFYFANEKSKKSVKSEMREDSPEIQELFDVLESYQKNAPDVQKRIPSYKGYKEYCERLKEEFFGEHNLEYFPVHYSQIDGRIYLSPACITKEIYYTSIQDILKKQGEHDTCKDFRKLCPTCKLFGMVGMDGNLKEMSEAEESKIKEKYPNAWASSVRVQDATLVAGQKDVFAGPVRLMELASPKKSSTEFYLQKPQEEKNETVLSWTYDYYVSKRGKGKPEVRPYTPKIAGRKFYWHHQTPNLPEKKYVEETNRNCTVTPVKKGVKFTFPVYFEKITKEQLDQLIWICNISQETKTNSQGKEESVYGYKVGKGKPLGLGSCEFHVTDVKIRSLKDKEGNISYDMKTYMDAFGTDYSSITYEMAGFDADVKGALLRMCNFSSTKGTPVTYPVSDGQSVKVAAEGYKWFVNNRYKYAKNSKTETSKGFDEIMHLGNASITKREELIFQQHAPMLTKDSKHILKVNRVEKVKKNPDTNKLEPKRLTEAEGIANETLDLTKNKSNDSHQYNGKKYTAQGKQGYQRNQKHDYKKDFKKKNWNNP